MIVNLNDGLVSCIQDHGSVYRAVDRLSFNWDRPSHLSIAADVPWYWTFLLCKAFHAARSTYYPGPYNWISFLVSPLFFFLCCQALTGGHGKFLVDLLDIYSYCTTLQIWVHPGSWIDVGSYLATCSVSPEDIPLILLHGCYSLFKSMNYLPVSRPHERIVCISLPSSYPIILSMIAYSDDNVCLRGYKCLIGCTFPKDAFPKQWYLYHMGISS